MLPCISVILFAGSLINKSSLFFLVFHISSKSIDFFTSTIQELHKWKEFSPILALVGVLVMICLILTLEFALGLNNYRADLLEGI